MSFKSSNKESPLDGASTLAQTERLLPRHIFEDTTDEIENFVFLHDNKRIVSSSRDGTMRKWDYSTGLLFGNPWEWVGKRITALALSPDGERVACGRADGGLQIWNIDREMNEAIWMGHDKVILRGHSNSVCSVSWSPNGGHIASGSSDGTILIRKAQNGKVEVGPIRVGQRRVCSLAYSPSGDRIALGGYCTICIWDSNAGDLLVGPITGLGELVTSVVWSSDSTKVYSASDEFVRVFDSTSGTLLHSFEHNNYVNCVALSPKQNLLACVGAGGTSQLWDTESHQPLGKPFSPEDSATLDCVSFSQDGQYLAYGGYDRKIMLWIVKNIAPELALPAPITQEETLSEPAPLSYLDVDATNPFTESGINDVTEEGRNDSYDKFFSSSHSSLHSLSSCPSPIRRLWGIFVVPSLLRTPANESVRLKEHLKRRFLTKRALSPPPLLVAPANKEPTDPASDGRVRTGEEHNKDVDLPDCSANMISGAAKEIKGKQRKELTDAETLPPDDASSTAELDTNVNSTFWKFLRARGKNAAASPAQMTHGPSLKVVEVCAVRVTQGYVTLKRKRKAKSSTLTTGTPTTAQASGSPQAGPSSHGHPAHGHISSLGQAGVSSQSIVGYGGQSSQVAGGLTTMDDSSDSDSIQGSWNKFLDKICFPCGHYEDD